MTHQTRLVLASIVFAVIWTLGMIWWTGPESVNVIILAVCGVLLGVAWYFAMKAFARWQSGRPH